MTLFLFGPTARLGCQLLLLVLAVYTSSCAGARSAKDIVSEDHHQIRSFAFVGTDNLDFLLEGVPNLVANQEPANYMESYHASTDTYDKADLAMLHANAAVTGTLIWGLANATDRARRQDRAAIQALLDATGLAEQMRTFDLDDDWVARRRGRPD